ncbi:MAG: pantoate--beta-alanine ligase [Pseudomonadota bacterium]
MTRREPNQAAGTPLNSTRPHIVRTVADLRHITQRWRLSGQSIAIVPTMGALHEGHLALIRAAVGQADRTIVSIFVNPKQFAPTEDLDTYPRTFGDDVAAAAAVGTDVIWAPTADAMYPQGFATSVTPEGAALTLEAASRPHFFTGVATVCTKLFLQSAADVAIFGEKDFQQLAVIRQIVRDLDIPLKVVAHETVRESDGLAMSSRNRYLAPEQRKIAPALYQNLCRAAERAQTGDDPKIIEKQCIESLLDAGFDTVDYVEIRHSDTLEKPMPDASKMTGDWRILAAATLGTTRLIDNMPIRFL